MDLLAKIAVSAAVFSMDKPYSYYIPGNLSVLPGQRVIVPFSRANRRVEGIVLSVEEGSPDGLKPVDRVLDAEPVMNGTMLRLAAFLRQRYFCTYYEAARTMLPAGLWFTEKDTYCLAEDGKEPPALAPDAALLYEELSRLGGSAERSALRRVLPDEGRLQEALRKLRQKNLVRSEADFLPRAGAKTEFVVTLDVSVEQARDFVDHAKNRTRQAEVLRLLCGVGSASSREIQYFTGASADTLRRLEQAGFVSISKREVLRRPASAEAEPADPPVLTGAQQEVLEGLTEQLASEKKIPALLYGVTGSGKTSVYIRLIMECLSRGRSAMLLVPEIALTPQLMRLMNAHFGQTVAVLHSALRPGERFDEWRRIRSGAARLVVGTRSAVFAPLQKPGLIILDEEQEHSYKSESSPRYHAREIALWRGVHEDALVLFGSATPSVESMYRAKSGEWMLYRLTERYNGRSLPPVEIADLREELKSGNGGSLSRTLVERLRETVSRGEQAILFINRRGNSRFLVCVECGAVPQCPRCSVSLTYHSANHRLMCHYCGYSQPLETECPVCGGHLKPMGAGTQKVELELAELLPGVETIRMDADTVTASNTHEDILSRFRKENIPILLGTQMVAKGLDFPNVTLVGVLDADLSLYVDHFRAAETTFSMLTQVIGRAGRGSAEGRALVQTMTPDHAVIRLAAAQDYDSFYETEIRIREARQFPPFSDLVTVGFISPSEKEVIRWSVCFRGWLEQTQKRENLDFSVLGPSPAPVAKINNAFYYRLTLLSRCTPELRRTLAFLMREFIKDPKTKEVRIYADVNPYE